MTGLQTNFNPLGWAQFHILSSPAGHARLAIGYPIVVGAIAMFCYRAMQPDITPARFAQGMIYFLIAGQGILLGIVSTGAIHKAVLRDFTTRMIDSHRLSGMPSWQAALGYLFGPNGQFLILAAENCAIGAVCAAFVTGRPVGAWLSAHGLMAATALFLWTGGLLLALASQGKGNLIGVVVAAAFLGGWTVVSLVPGLTLLLGFVTFFTRQVQRVAAGGSAPIEVFFTVPAQLVLAAIFFAAAARKLRREDVQAFDWRLGMVLSAVVAALLISGMGLADQIGNPLGRALFEKWPLTKAFASACVLTLVGLIPIAAAAQAGAWWCRRARLDPAFREPAPPHELYIAVLVGGIVVAAFLPVLAEPLAEAGIDWREWAKSAACLALGLVMFCGFLRCVYAYRERALLPGLFFFALVWLGPLLMEAFLAIYGQLDVETDEIVPSPIIGVSPVGAALVIAGGKPVMLWPGICAQGLLALALCLRHARRPRPGKDEPR